MKYWGVIILLLVMSSVVAEEVIVTYTHEKVFPAKTYIIYNSKPIFSNHQEQIKKSVQLETKKQDFEECTRRLTKNWKRYEKKTYYHGFQPDKEYDKEFRGEVMKKLYTDEDMCKKVGIKVNVDKNFVTKKQFTKEKHTFTKRYMSKFHGKRFDKYYEKIKSLSQT